MKTQTACLLEEQQGGRQGDGAPHKVKTGVGSVTHGSSPPRRRPESLRLRTPAAGSALGWTRAGARAWKGWGRLAARGSRCLAQVGGGGARPSGGPSGLRCHRSSLARHPFRDKIVNVRAQSVKPQAGGRGGPGGGAAGGVSLWEHRARGRRGGDPGPGLAWRGLRANVGLRGSLCVGLEGMGASGADGDTVCPAWSSVCKNVWSLPVGGGSLGRVRGGCHQNKPSVLDRNVKSLIFNLLMVWMWCGNEPEESGKSVSHSVVSNSLGSHGL